ncbi:helix-turn-helix transcriptional regulator [Nocardioides terrigena]|uniref:helix-turn-helix transcriptional regulator n=1 Tax=Nocardioides terrigena TaxID=424797 RepID=UPI00131EE528|nr:LuxR C-terminal-related transcriptional regulator [Nocardioides terrigena]
MATSKARDRQATAAPRKAPKRAASTRGAPTRREPPVPGAPWLPQPYAPRHELWAHLDAATESAVTVLVAPAGAGKTLGVAGWLATTTPLADPIWYAASATSTVAQVEEVLSRAAGTPDSPPRLLVVDDAHLLSAACVRLVAERLDADPEQLRILLMTRWDLAIPRLVPELLGHMTVLRGDVLRLSREESAWLALQHAGATRGDVLEAIVERAGGWCAALVLAARASAAMQPGDDVAAMFRTSGGTVADLVAGEVFVGLRPQERHLLLCVSGETDLTEETARHLTRDPRAGEALSSLESTGLLVSKVSAVAGVPGGEERYRIHPLLSEVVRRRLVAGGVDVQRATATVLRATWSDLAGGHTADAMRRLLVLGRYDDAGAVLAEHGARLVMAGEDECVDAFLRAAGPAIDEHPASWGLIARSRWAAGDADAGRHWADRLLRHEKTHPGTVSALEYHSILLHRSRSSGAHQKRLVDAALVEVERAVDAVVPDPHLPLVLLEVGVAENWLGLLPAAEEHLTRAVLLCRAEGLGVAAAKALSHLALTQFMLGREQACHALAEESLALAEQHPRTPASARARAELARMLVWFETFPLPPTPEPDPATPGDPAGAAPWQLPTLPQQLDDLTAEFWRQVMQARLALLGGSVPDSLRALEALSPLQRLPQHLRICALVEQAGLAVITGNRSALRTLADALGEAGAEGERLWVLGAAEDVDGDLRKAATLYQRAAAGSRRGQPPTRALALTCAAQLCDYLGETETAHDLVVQAVDATASRRLGSPFLGWSRHGTRIGHVLAGAKALDDSGWGVELREACAELPGLSAMFAPVVATEHELATVSETHRAPSLSPRELEVLRELARGSTYSDAAANLFVSENTVKTHVSSLYTKLSVGRRSEALAVARKLHLI